MQARVILFLALFALVAGCCPKTKQARNDVVLPKREDLESPTATASRDGTLDETTCKRICKNATSCAIASMVGAREATDAGEGAGAEAEPPPPDTSRKETFVICHTTHMDPGACKDPFWM